MSCGLQPPGARSPAQLRALPEPWPGPVVQAPRGPTSGTTCWPAGRMSSILALLAIAVDRYLRVKIPLRYKMVVTPRRASVAIAGCWLLSFLVGLTPMFGWNNLDKLKQEANGSLGDLVIRCEFEKVISMEYMVYFNFFVWVLPPLLLMVFIYLEVFYLIRKQLNKKVSGSSGDPQKYYGKELKIAKSLALILFLFALSWLPLHILNCITLFCPDCQKPSILTYIAIFLTHGNSAMNPIVYAFRIQKFRTTFLQIWNQHFRCRAVPPSDNEDAPEEKLDN
ncbi:adenosine receptor A1 isoform X3 [Notamacropus eugenii]|uniref:adenosine receptor A1 isoform X3 n=1 Tax=Notamacropus eugenii TaxID=9315 RepID=UPI003B670F4D